MPSSARRATQAAWSVDGLVASEVVTPGDPQEAGDALAAAAAAGLAVSPVGGGTALSLGNRPERLDIILSTKGLAGIIDYEPTDLVLSVGAGSRLADVQAVLAEHGQRLPIDPPGGDGATIGGLIATARWGPLRHSAGTLRDLLIGISVAHATGTVSRAGGMVVKNVSGYDMPRLYHGSLGTLGVIVSANFKVLPRPRTEATVLVTFADAAAAFAAAARLRSGMEPLAALEVALRDDTWQVAARIEGREPTVDAVAARVAAGAATDSLCLGGPASAAWWDDYVAQQRLTEEPSTALVRCSCRPKDTAVLASGMVPALGELGVTVPFLAATPGLGTVMSRLGFGSEGSAERLAEVQAVLLDLAESVTILSAPSDWKRGIDVWGRLPDGFDVMRALRHEFDPNRTINPGRFAGFL